MAIKIHHNTAKRAARLGITLTVVENEVEASHNGQVLASAPSGNVALDKAERLLGTDLAPVAGAMHAIKAKKPVRKAKKLEVDLELEDEGDEIEEVDGSEDEDDDKGSIVKGKYKTRYKPFKMTCGDDLAAKIREHVTMTDKDGNECVSKTALKQLAQANGAWNPRYSDLNVGQQRMNVGNRLRAIQRKGGAIKWP